MTRINIFTISGFALPKWHQRSRDFSHINELKYRHGLSFHLPFLRISIQSQVKAFDESAKLGSFLYQLVKIIDVIGWSQTYSPSKFISLPPVHAVHSLNIFVEQFSAEEKSLFMFVFIECYNIWRRYPNAMWLWNSY